MVLTLADCGEQALIARLRPYCLAAFVGDDAAVLSLPKGEQLIVSSDALVDGVHFSLGMATPVVTMTPEDVGWRAAAANLSDLAAMGALPLGLTVAVTAPAHCPVATIEGIYQGLAACCRTYGTGIVGGDTCCSSVLSLSVTALGAAPPERVIYRQQAMVGDAIVVTGVHGAARAGLECLLHPDWATQVPEAIRQSWIKAHQRPRPRLDVVRWLRQQSPPPRVAGMDTSDGLAAAVQQIAQASAVGATLWAEKIPQVPLLVTDLARHWALYGGEDFELVLCLPFVLAAELCGAVGSSAAIIGEVTADTTVQLIVGDRQVPLDCQQTFQHFSSHQ